MADKPKKRERFQFVAMHNMTPVNVHSADDPATALQKYYKKAFDKTDLDDKDKGLIAKKAANLAKTGKASFKSYTFLKINPEQKKPQQDKK